MHSPIADREAIALNLNGAGAHRLLGDGAGRSCGDRGAVLVGRGDRDRVPASPEAHDVRSGHQVERPVVTAIVGRLAPTERQFGPPAIHDETQGVHGQAVHGIAVIVANVS